jgi:DNA polymerase
MWAIETHGTIDFETYSEAGHEWDDAAGTWRAPPGATKKGIAAVGSVAYAEHPSTEVLTMSYRLPGGALRRWRPGLPNPQDLFDYLASGGLIEAHNAMFERAIWHYVCRRLYGWPELPAAQLRCSMAKAHVNNLPGALGNLTDVLPVKIKKNPDGKRLLNKFSVPQKPTKAKPVTRIRPEDDPEDAERLYAYCDVDVEAEEEASALMMPLSLNELRFWLLDQRMNWRGIGVDRPGVRNMIAVLEQAQDKYGTRCREITGGFGPGQVKELRGWLAARGIYLDSMDAEAVETGLATLGITDECKGVLRIRQLVGSASVKKLYAFERSANTDDRVRNVITHHGARTGRPTGELVQPLNLPKSGPDLFYCGCGKPHARRDVCPWCGVPVAPGSKSYKWPDVPKGYADNPVDHVQTIMATRSLDAVEWFFGDALLSISGCVRGMIVAGPGYDLVASDYSAIEAVVTAALSGCEWRVQTFRENRDIYLMSAAQRPGGLTYEEYQAYKEENGAHHWHRQKWGKVFELACLGPRTQVLTDKGYLAIVDVTTDHKVWDGIEWVRHEGLVKRGTKTVLNLDGLQITPDHLVSLNGSWKAANELASDDRLLTQALVSGLEALLRLEQSNGGATANMSRKSSATVARPRIGWRFITSATASLLGAIRALRKRPQRTVSSIFVTPARYQMTNTVGGCSTDFLRPLDVATIQNQKGLATTAGAGSECVKSGAATRPRFFDTPILCRGGTSRLLKWIGETRTATMSLEILGSFPKWPTLSTNGRSATGRPSSTTTSSVYDLANAGPRHRFTVKTNSGHLVVHNCGFGGWVGAVRVFDTETPDDEVKAGILAWRAASPEIVEMWGGQARGKPWMRDYRLERFGFEGAFVNAVQYPGHAFTSNGIIFYTRGDALIIRLLSGRELTYHSPRLWPKADEPGVFKITYMTWNSNPKYGPTGWVAMETYAGRIAENIVQATAHDIQRFGIEALEAAGYGVVLHVYDENVAEVPHGFGSIEEFEAIMSTMPPWAAGWPVRASGGWRGRRYRKG